MTQTANDITTPQQPDTLATPQAHSTDSAPSTQPVVTHHVATPIQHFNTEIPQTLIRPHDSIFHPTLDTTEYLLLCNDSLFLQYDSVPLRQRQSMFVANTHSRPEAQPQIHHAPAGGDWIFGTVILLLALVSIYINNQRFKLKDIFQSIFDTRTLERVFRESHIRSVSLLPMVGIYLAALAMLVLKATQSLDGYVISMPPYLFFCATLLGLIAFILLKNGFIHLLGNIFEDRTATALYISSNDLFYFIGSLIATPLLLLVFYFDNAHYTVLKIALIFIAILFIIRIIRGMQLILTNSKTSKLYLFYYLCILEIVPVLVIAKVILI